MDIGTALRALRAKKKIKQGELCRETGISQTYMSLIEKGTKKPSTPLLEKIAAFYNVPLEALFFLTLNEDNVAVSKKRFFNQIKPTLDSIIDELFIKDDLAPDEN
jgi:transcriptional regulator with XRE-family HTH domain